jgi:mRNA-degrading endonuclease RelE of RelBE toxin-antitoxin system
MWKIEFLPEAISDLSRIDKPIKAIVLKGINKVATNPVAQIKGGYGKRKVASGPDSTGS